MRKIAIVGADITEEELLDIDLAGYELWSVNNLYVRFPNVKFTRWFELHTFEKDTESGDVKRRGRETYSNKPVFEYMGDIDKLKIPVMMQKKWPGIIRRTRLFPFRRIMKHYGEYFGCSFAWMTALAIYEHEVKGCPVEEIFYIGVSLAGKEYYYQRPSTEYFMGLARGKGIECRVHPSSKLLTAKFVYAIRENFSLIHLLYVYHIDKIATDAMISVQEIYEDLYDAEADTIQD